MLFRSALVVDGDAITPAQRVGDSLEEIALIMAGADENREHPAGAFRKFLFQCQPCEPCQYGCLACASLAGEDDGPRAGQTLHPFEAICVCNDTKNGDNRF